ncbi:hypothetical protein KO494_00015 [Lacinutrix sp. C3R15]|uniref:hypothetical protein n=1 Tax=Flavobacteriaceae TaxID=49546 RepID=UPI001C0A1F19|nr:MULTISPECIES: hypothetical protein [Flavobacteriaceae]MBU2937910.1 hypothetical protein [Lacinutrix sp. C3R15]MDO6621224.1 hypothetical protein [Oceanihabitans sp. 1_MG-2023]
MKKSIYILILALVFNSCQNEKKLNGTWISAYKQEENDTLNYDLSGVPFNEIWEFNDGTLKIQRYKYDFFYEDVSSFKFKLKGNKFVINDNEPYLSDIIEPIKKDSFVLSGFTYGNSKLVYKKLDDSLKNNTADFKLTGNKYIRNFKKWTDTIHFVNESVYTSSGWTMGNSELKWERVNYNGFDILFTDIYIPFILKKKVGNKIYVTTFDKQKEDYILEQIE